jgi:hypothetical protein
LLDAYQVHSENIISDVTFRHELFSSLIHGTREAPGVINVLKMLSKHSKRRTEISSKVDSMTHTPSIPKCLSRLTFYINFDHSFRYLGSMLQKDGDIDENVSHRIKVGWLK